MTNSASRTVTVAASVGDAVGFTLTLDAGAAIDLTVTDEGVSYVLAGLAEGEHTVKLDAQDSLGNLASTSVSFTVDTVAPSVAIVPDEQGVTHLLSKAPIDNYSTLREPERM